ncbi:MAG: NADH-quinone oxidoreductase subunit M [Myxococcota bacterium]
MTETHPPAPPPSTTPWRRTFVYGVLFLAFVVVPGVWAVGDGPGSSSGLALLELLVATPFVGAGVVMLLPRQAPWFARAMSYGFFALAFILSLMLLREPLGAAWSYRISEPWVEATGSRWHLAIDGLSLWFVYLTTLTTPIAAFAALGSHRSHVKELCAAFLLLEGALLGAFVAVDVLLFFIFFDLTLVPMFIMIAIWGGKDRVRASLKFFLFAFGGSAAMLGSIVYLMWIHHDLTGVWSTDLLDLARVSLPVRDGAPLAAELCFWGFSVAALVKVPMFPLHSWLPDARTEAPAGLSAIMVKVGAFAYLRVVMTLFPGFITIYARPLASLAVVGGILFAGLAAWKQSNARRIVAYAAVASMGFVMLGLFSGTLDGFRGGLLLIVNHGLTTAALFLLIGVLEDRRGRVDFDALGGLAKAMPVYAALFVTASMAAIGMPGSAAFAGELAIILASYGAPNLADSGPFLAAGAAAGLIMAAVYMLHAVQQMFFGPLRGAKNARLRDITPREALAIVPLIALTFVVGLFPGKFLSPVDASIAAFHAQFQTVAREDLQRPGTAPRLRTRDSFSDAFRVSAAPAVPRPSAR